MVILASIIILSAMTLYVIPINHWLRATFSGVKVDLKELIFMRIRKSPVHQIVDGLIVCQKAGISINLQQLETHAIAGGQVEKVVKTMIKANQKGISVEFREVCTWDLAEWNMEDRLREKSNNTDSQNLKIEIFNKVKTLSDRQLVELQSFMSQFR